MKLLTFPIRLLFRLVLLPIKIVLAIQTQLGIPVKLVGLGETADDLVAFDADEFVDALFS